MYIYNQYLTIYEKFQKYSFWSKYNIALLGWDLHAR